MEFDYNEFMLKMIEKNDSGFSRVLMVWYIVFFYFNFIFCLSLFLGGCVLVNLWYINYSFWINFMNWWEIVYFFIFFLCLWIVVFIM